MDYSKSEMDHMRQEALRRTREMHSRARPQADSKVSHGKAEDSPKKPNDVSRNSEKMKIPVLGDLLPGLDIDGDRLLILLLIIMLSRDGADMKLLVALFYIMM